MEKERLREIIKNAGNGAHLAKSEIIKITIETETEIIELTGKDLWKVLRDGANKIHTILDGITKESHGLSWYNQWRNDEPVECVQVDIKRTNRALSG
jgi:hypothetical protein